MLRSIAGVITVLLGLVHDLDATATLSVIMALFVLCLVWETVTSLRKGACVFEKWEDTQYPERLGSGGSGGCEVAEK